MTKLHDVKFYFIDCPPYSPDLVSSDYHLFLEHYKRFRKNEEIIPEINTSFYQKCYRSFRLNLPSSIATLKSSLIWEEKLTLLERVEYGHF